MRRPGLLLLGLPVTLLALTAPASALPLPILPPAPGAGGVVETVGGVLDPVVTDPQGTVGGVAGDVTETLGGVLTDPETTLEDIFDDVLTTVGGGTGGGTTGGGTTGGTVLPPTVLDAILGRLTGTAPATTVAGQPPAAVVGGGGAVNAAADIAAPRVVLKVLSKVGAAARTGVLKVRVTADEAGVVAFDGRLRAGKARRVKGRSVRVSRALLRTKPLVLAFNRAGSVTASLALPRRAPGILRKVRTARVSLSSWASDLSRNQTAGAVRKTIRR